MQMLQMVTHDMLPYLASEGAVAAAAAGAAAAVVAAAGCEDAFSWPDAGRRTYDCLLA